MKTLCLRWITIAVVISTILAVALGCTGVKPSTAADPIRLGAFLGLSGDISGYGEMQKKGIELAAREVTESGFLGTKFFQVIVADTGPGDEGAAQTARQLIQTGEVSGLIGPTLSRQAFISDPLAQAAGIPVIAISNTVPGITEMGDYVFRCSLPDSTLIARTVEVTVTKSNIKRVGVLWQRDDTYSIGVYQVFVQSFYRNGVDLVGDVTYATGETDFKAQLGKLISSKPDAIAVAAHFVNEASRVLLQARELGYHGLIIGGNGFLSPDIIRETGVAADGVIVGTAWNNDGQSPRNMAFKRLFENTYKILPDQFAAQAYTAVWLYAEAAKNTTPPGPGYLRNALSTIRGYETPLGSFSFSELREPEHPSAVKMIRDGRFVTIAP
jgi:branched-chain amino acid transport system substrate-binding protein